MATQYGRHFSSRKTPQSQPIPGQDMVKNNAGGFVFQVDEWTQLGRFLINGSEKGSYYVGEPDLTVENAQNVVDCVRKDGLKTVETIVQVSDSGRAPKNDPALYALAICSGMGDEATRKAALAALPKVARIGTHVEHFAEYMQGFRGWGRGARRAFANWFLEMDVDRLAYQAVKFKQRDGWALRDLLRLSHPRTDDAARNAVFHYITQGQTNPEDEATPKFLDVVDLLNAPFKMEGHEKAGREMVQGAALLIAENNIPREAVPTELLGHVEIWEALLQNMPMTAMIRNLGKMSSIGLLAPLSDASRKVCEALGNETALSHARIHPINVLSAMLTYGAGHGFRGKLEWNTVPQVVDALDGAFYKSFQNVRPTGKRYLIALDVSYSMSAIVNGMPFLSAATAAAAMSMVTARTEQDYHFMGFSHQFVPLNITARQRLDDVVRTTRDCPMGGTDCALPMIWALENKVPVDAFLVYTDNETWAGNIHPVQALQNYRQQMGIPAKMVVAAMTATKFSIGDGERYGYGGTTARAVADPNDGGMLDVAGLDSAAPTIISDFVRE